MNTGSVSNAQAQLSGSLRMMVLTQDQMKAEGLAAIKLIETTKQIQPPSPAHDGKGHKVNLLA